MNKTIIYSLILAIVIIAYSCDPENSDNEPTPESPSIEKTLNAISNYIIVNKIFSDSFSEADKAAKDGDKQLEQNKNLKTTYPIITITPADLTTWPKQIKVDYGINNILCGDGVNRRGIINLSTTGLYHEPGTEVAITFDGFYHNNHKVEGEMFVINTGRNDNNNLVYNVIITNGKITTPENKILYFTENTSREWAAGEETIFNVCDDNYFITGTQEGVSSDSLAYNLVVMQKLDIIGCCKYIRAGLLKITIIGLPPFTVNYGEGECDANAIVTVNGVEYPIEM